MNGIDSEMIKSDRENTVNMQERISKTRNQQNADNIN